MRSSFVIALVVALLASHSSRNPVYGDVGACWVMFGYSPSPAMKLNEEQQKQIGDRLQQAHVSSSTADGHMVFLCYIGHFNSGEEAGALYRITEGGAKIGSDLKGFTISAPDFAGLLLAAKEFEQAGEENRLWSVKLGYRQKETVVPLCRDAADRK